MSSTTRNAGFFYGCLAAGAGRALLAKNLQVISEVAFLTASVYKVLKSSATDGYAFFHDVSGGGA